MHKEDRAYISRLEKFVQENGYVFISHKYVVRCKGCGCETNMRKAETNRAQHSEVECIVRQAEITAGGW